MKTSLVAIVAVGIIILAIVLTLILIPHQEPDDTVFKPLPKEWQSSGPFEIDRSKYAIGEKIFLLVHELEFDEKGQIDIMRPVNATHQVVWDSIPFNGAVKSAFDFYFEPKIQRHDAFCSVDDLIGKWSFVFRGTNYPNLDFEIDKRVVRGTNIEPIC
ncbi:MAG: hypothetical protein IIA83_10195 [Thaumarchaeota archaeon]|nr:hypothetical protein [Nitrososphaerota archaeon]